MKLRYRIGNVLEPVGEGPNIIAHSCNDRGGWGAGLVLKISEKWPMRLGANSPEYCYREWHKRLWKGKHFVLGQIQPVWVQHDIWVVNMIAQRDYGGLYEEGVKLNLPNINYSSLLECMTRLSLFMGNKASLHIPRIGTKHGGGSWLTVEKIVNMVFGDLPNPVWVYDQEAVVGTTYE